MTAWLNYYLHFEDECYSTLFGDGLQQDIAQNSISVEYANQPRNFQGYGTTQWVLLTWEGYDHPVLGGYNIYRRASDGVYSSKPYRQLALTGSFADPIGSRGATNGYKVCSYDKGGNQHQCSEEIIITAGESEPAFLPIIL
ncbi:MAG: hypothetical protein ACK2UM_06025 [Anaerolineales bacterium]|jgi:hypothetical protein